MGNPITGIFHSGSYVDLSLYQFGYERCEPLHSFGPAVRNHFLFHYVLSGSGRLASTDSKGQGHEYSLREGQGFLLLPGQANSYYADGQDPWEYTWLEFDGLKARELLAQAGLGEDTPVYVGQNDRQREQMKNEMLFIVNHADRPPLELIGHLYLFVSALIQSSSVRKKVAGGSLREFYARESLSFIEQHYRDEITVEDIAAFCNLERSYLGKVFKSVLGAGPQEFLIRYRMNKACELLKITDRPVGEIGRMVGYPNQLNFSRAFKHAIGMSPRDFRTQNKLR